MQYAPLYIYTMYEYYITRITRQSKYIIINIPGVLIPFSDKRGSKIKSSRTSTHTCINMHTNSKLLLKHLVLNKFSDQTFGRTIEHNVERCS